MRRLNYILLTFLLIVVTIFAVPLSVYAATEDRAVQAEGGQHDGTYLGGAADYTNLNIDDGATTVLAVPALSGYRYNCFNMQDFVTSYTTINSVTLLVKAAAGGLSQTITPYVRISGTNYYGTEASLPSSGLYTEFTKTWATNPSTGTAWTSTTLNAAEFGFRIWPAATYAYVTYQKITVDYAALSAPTVTTDAASGIIYDGSHKATLNGTVTDDGGGTIDYYGFVWDTSDKGDPGNADPSGPPGTWSNGWKSGAGDYGENPFSHQVTGLIINTTYYFRAAAHNASGWSYGDAVSFRTLTNPAITTLAATNVSATTARLNASVTDDGMAGGGEDCTVVFVYKENAGAHYADYAAILGAGGTEVTATGTYNTGGLPYYDISGITVSTNVDFAVKITNSVSTQYGGVLWFTTESGVSEPTNFNAIPTSTSISLSWTKGVGASNTFIRYDTATYPTAITGGLGTVYAGTGNSYLLESLTPGKSYYFSAWGLTAGTYSASYAQVMATCLATGASGVPTLPSPDTPGAWNLTLSTSAISNLPFHEFADYFADEYEIPQTTMWYGLIIMFSVAAGLFAYWRGNNNILAGMLVCAIGLAVGAVVWQLVYLWILVFFLMAGFTMAWLNQRYS